MDTRQYTDPLIRKVAKRIQRHPVYQHLRKRAEENQRAAEQSEREMKALRTRLEASEKKVEALEKQIEAAKEKKA